MKTKHPFILLILLFLLFLLAACAQGATELKAPEIRYGEDVCADCNMIISDPRFASAYAYEVGPGRYQSVLFDDPGDMLNFAGKNSTHKVVAWYVHDYETKEWTDATTASFLVSGDVETPMASGIVSFASRDRAEAMAYSLGTEVIDWNTLQAKHKAGEIGAGMAGPGGV
jgi:copper chaperone NosL